MFKRISYVPANVFRFIEATRKPKQKRERFGG